MEGKERFVSEGTYSRMRRVELRMWDWGVKERHCCWKTSAVMQTARTEDRRKRVKRDILVISTGTRQIIEVAKG